MTILSFSNVVKGFINIAGIAVSRNINDYEVKFLKCLNKSYFVKDDEDRSKITTFKSFENAIVNKKGVIII